MQLVPNIDERGKAYRRRGGTALIVLGIVTGAWPVLTGSFGGFIVSGLLIVTGAFMLFEARNSWCALRAAGIKTRL